MSFCRFWAVFSFSVLFSGVVSLSQEAQVPKNAPPAANPSSGKFDGPAELPRVYVNSAVADTPAPGQTHDVREGESLQAAIDGASCGDTLRLQAGATFHGQFHFPDKFCDDSHWIILRSSAPDNELPPEGTRLTPCYAGVASLPGRPDFHCRSVRNVLAKIEFDGNNGSGPLAFLPGANHYRFLGLEVTRGAPGASISALAFVKGGAANHLVFDRVWMHGTAQDETTRGLGMHNMTYVAVVDSYFTDFHCVAGTGACTDAQDMGSTGSSLPNGPYKIEDNFLEASGQSILFGGGEATVAPADIVIRRNHLFKPLIWHPNQPGFVGGLSGHPFIVKNHFELKNAQRVLFEDNLLENVWGGFSQAGFSILLTPKNQNNHCPLCVVTDVTIRYCAIRNVGGGFQIANATSDAGGASSGGERYSIHDVIVDEVHENDLGSFGLFAMVMSFSPPLANVRIEHVTAFTPRAAFSIQSRPKMANFKIDNNIFVLEGDRQIGSPGGGPSNCAFRPDQQGPAGVIRSCFVDSSFTHNIIVGGMGWGSGNMTPGSLKAAGIRQIREPGALAYSLCQEKDPGECKRASPALKAGTDGRDIGADVAGIRRALEGVI
ncbi:MAG TPA: hypothetical protein VF133_03490 [Terriglobales bacterium]